MLLCTGCQQPRTDPKRSLCTECAATAERVRYHARNVAMDQKRIELIDDRLAAFGLPMEREAAAAVIEHKDIGKAAEVLSMTPSRLRALLFELQRRAARSGWSPAHQMVNSVPAGFHVKGVSTLYGADGEVRGQWVKSNKDQEHQYALLVDAFRSMASDWKGIADPIAAPTAELNEDLLAVYPLGDPHIGMFSWAAETGSNFDLKIAERNLFSAMDRLVFSAPSAKTALIVDLGDFFHADNSTNMTMRSHNVLDVDGRRAKVLRTGLRLSKRLIDRSLEKHERSHVIIQRGNHDDDSSIVLAMMLEQAYEREPRVTIDTSPAAFHWYRFGLNLIGTAHGDTCKMIDLPGVMAADRAKDWGETEHRYWLTGHIHHDSLKEFPGCKVESFRTLAPRDAWHASKGYRSGQDMKCIVLHKRYGEVSRTTFGITQLTEQ